MHQSVTLRAHTLAVVDPKVNQIGAVILCFGFWRRKKLYHEIYILLTKKILILLYTWSPSTLKYVSYSKIHIKHNFDLQTASPIQPTRWNTPVGIQNVAERTADRRINATNARNSQLKWIGFLAQLRWKEVRKQNYICMHGFWCLQNDRKQKNAPKKKERGR